VTRQPISFLIPRFQAMRCVHRCHQVCGRLPPRSRCREGGRPSCVCASARTERAGCLPRMVPPDGLAAVYTGVETGTGVLSLALHSPALTCLPKALPREVAGPREVQAEACSAVAGRPSPERLVTVLFSGRGSSYREVSAFRKIGLPTVKKRLYSARKTPQRAVPGQRAFSE
jgi:hypothetical protein